MANPASKLALMVLIATAGCSGFGSNARYVKVHNCTYIKTVGGQIEVEFGIEKKQPVWDEFYCPNIQQVVMVLK